MFPDWNALIRRDAATLMEIIERDLGGSRALRILDPTCGIGTQVLGLAQSGYIVTGLDISAAAIERARHEASQRKLDIRLEVADVRTLRSVGEDEFDVAVSLGNSLCTLATNAELVAALSEIRMKLRPGGLIVAGIRDYSSAVNERPVRIDELMHCMDGPELRVVHQVWCWLDASRYITQMYIDTASEHHTGSAQCRAVLRPEFTAALVAAGFENIRWTPADETTRPPGVYESGFSQLIVVARCGEQ
jgi:SAM-dependent methyltransferase